MKPRDKKADVSDSPLHPADDEAPGVPGFRTWAGVYWFAFGVFVAGVVALTLFSRAFA